MPEDIQQNLVQDVPVVDVTAQENPAQVSGPGNPIYKFMKDNNLTTKDEKTFLNEYSNPKKASELHSFMLSNNLTTKDSASFYDTYLKKKDGTIVSGPSELPSSSQETSFSLKPKAPKKNYYGGSEFDLGKARLESNNAGLIFDKSGQLFAPSSQVLSKEIPQAENIDLKKSTQKDLVEKVIEEEKLKQNPIEEQKQEEGSYWNILPNLVYQGLTKFADIDLGAIKFLRNLSGKIPFANKPEEIYDENGNLTNYGKNIETFDFLGQAIKSIREGQIKDKNLLENKYALPKTTSGEIASGVTGIIPDIALATMTGGKNLFSGTGTLASIGNAITGAFVREQAIVGAAKGYNKSDNKGAGETFLNTIKEGGKGAGQGALYELAGFGGGRLGNVLSGSLKNTTAKGAVNLAARLATFSLGVPVVEKGIEEGRLPNQGEILQNLGVSGAMELFHLVPKAFGKKGEVEETPESNPEIEANVAKHVNDIRSASALNNFMKAPNDVIDNLIKSDQTAQDLNLAAMDAVKRAESMPDGEEKSKVLQTVKDLTNAADIKHITDVIKNSPDALSHLADDLPAEIRDPFMQKAQAIHQSLNPAELQKQAHVDNIIQAIDIIKQNESLASPNNPNVRERLEAQREIDKAKATIDASTKDFNKTSDEQEAQRQALQDAKLAQQQAPIKPAEEISVYHGGNIKDLTNSEGGLFVSADKNQAESYAKGNKGQVQEFKLNKNDISNENNVREIINELGLKSKEEGWDLNDLMLHEIIDPRFETSLSEGDLKRLYNELDKRGYKAIEMLATDVSGKQKNVNDILILNPKETLKTEVKPTEVKPTEVKTKIKDFTSEGGNKIVDEKGQPKVVFTGTNANKLSDIDALYFENDKTLKEKLSDLSPNYQIFFTDNKSEAKSYGKNTFEANVYIKNPVKNKADLVKTKSQLIKEGYDGYIWKSDDGRTHYIVFDKSQIKEVKPIEEQLKTKENAIQEPSTGSIFQYPQEGVGEAGGERKRVEPSIKGTEAAKESEQAKINEEKGLSMKGIRASETRKLNEEASNIEPSDARSAALKYLSGANLSQEAINEIAGSVKRAQLNTGKRELKTQEAKLRDYVAKKGEGVGLDEAAHNIWDNMSEEMQSKNTTQDVKEALMQAVLEHKTKAEAAKALVEGYKETDIEEQMNKYYEQFADENPDKMDEEMAKLEESMSNPEDDNYEFDYPEEHINNLKNQYEKESETKAEQPAERNKEKIVEEISSGKIGPEAKELEATLITHAANEETRKQLGLEQPELLSNLTDKERYDKAQEILKKGYDINKLIDKMYNPEEILNPVENAISNLYKQSLLSEIEKNPSDENLALAKIFLDARDQANSRAGAALQSLKGEAPEVSLLDFYVNKMEDNNTDILTDKQKEEAKKEYEAIKAKLDIAEAKNQELQKLNSELLAQKAIDEQKSASKKKGTTEKRDYTAERKEVIDSIKDKLKKARTGQGGLTSVPVPYAKELIEIAPDVAKLAKLYVEEGVEKLEDVVSKIHGVLKDEISGLQKKDIQDVLAGKYGKPSKAKTEVERKLNDLKTEAKLLDKIEEAKQLKPRSEKEKVEQNKTLTDLRKELNKVRKETGYYDEARLKSIIEKNKKETQELKDKLDRGDFEQKEKTVSFIENPELKKKYPKLYNEWLDAVDAKDEQQHKYDLKRIEDQMNSLSKREKIQAQVKKFGKEGFSTVKALKAGVDNSAVFVQNGLAVLNPMNYKATGKALKAQTQDFFSEAKFRRRIVEVHENKPLWSLIKESGLDYLDPKGYNQAMREEQFGSTNWLERKIKIGNKEFQIAKYTTAPFERLFTSFSNEFRLQIFLRGAEQLAKEGKTFETNPQEYKDLASYVNNITGRGKIHEILKPSENVISNVIWAPKLLSSTLNVMGLGDVANLGKNKGYYRSMTPRMRKYAIAQTAAGIGTGVALMAAYSLLPNKQVDWDPESVTFGQVKDTETGWGYNIFGRLTPVIRYIAMVTTLTKKVGQGKAQVVDPLKETYKFVRGKMQPTAGIFSDLMMRKDFSGKPYKLSNVPSDLFEPLFINELRQQLAIDGTSSLLTKGIPAFYGLKVSNDKMYDKRDLKSLESTVDSSTIDKNTLFNYNENRPVNTHEYKEFVSKRDSLLKSYYKNITEKGVPIVNKNGEVQVLPIDSKELTKDLLMKELGRLKGLATKNAKKELFGSKETTDEELDANDELKDLRDEQGIGNQEEDENQ